MTTKNLMTKLLTKAYVQEMSVFQIQHCKHDDLRHGNDTVSIDVIPIHHFNADWKKSMKSMTIEQLVIFTMKNDRLPYIKQVRLWFSRARILPIPWFCVQWKNTSIIYLLIIIVCEVQKLFTIFKHICFCCTTGVEIEDIMCNIYE